jgi:hypothetical protein
MIALEIYCDLARQAEGIRITHCIGIHGKLFDHESSKFESLKCGLGKTDNMRSTTISQGNLFKVFLRRRTNIDWVAYMQTHNQLHHQARN